MPKPLWVVIEARQTKCPTHPPCCGIEAFDFSEEFIFSWCDAMWERGSTRGMIGTAIRELKAAIANPNKRHIEDRMNCTMVNEPLQQILSSLERYFNLTPLERTQRAFKINGGHKAKR
eukprot:TRINITY_DN4939_c0_g1_i1.p2 TRINITY_DN4939_c0_g1~~TRINITY_DN4939_c0_g1_i1.p2  ORF type:complete len:118 (-),score=11.33 TRINITY_DN4939_c0_g1_i1:42-395(-)